MERSEHRNAVSKSTVIDAIARANDFERAECRERRQWLHLESRREHIGGERLEVGRIGGKEVAGRARKESEAGKV